MIQAVFDLQGIRKLQLQRANRKERILLFKKFKEKKKNLPEEEKRCCLTEKAVSRDDI